MVRGVAGTPASGLSARHSDVFLHEGSFLFHRGVRLVFSMSRVGVTHFGLFSNTNVTSRNVSRAAAMVIIESRQVCSHFECCQSDLYYSYRSPVYAEPCYIASISTPSIYNRIRMFRSYLSSMTQLRPLIYLTPPVCGFASSLYSLSALYDVQIKMAPKRLPLTM